MLNRVPCALAPVRHPLVLVGMVIFGLWTAAGCLERPVVSSEPQTTNVFIDRIEQDAVDKLDLLFVIDNSASMADKQGVLAKAVPQLLERLLNPPCVRGDKVVAVEVASAACPEGSRREFRPIDDVHIGVISSSLGAHGGDYCGQSGAASENDRAHLLATVREGLPSWNDQGFLVWDPNAKKSPPGQGDLQQLVSDFQKTIVAAGEQGCGFEATLEAWYRFLVDPEPPLEVVRDGARSVARGVDETILRQRQAFLRPDSLLGIIMLTDENDCSVIDHGAGWVATRRAHLPAATSACAEDANSPCCRSCATAEARPPDGCSVLEEDPACSHGQLEPVEDHANLRCYDQKRRFGIDMLYPLSRYLEGLRSPTVENRSGESVANPLYRSPDGSLKSRSTSLVYLAGIVGVPWQDVATEASLVGSGLAYLSADELEQHGRWPLMVGGPDAPPEDPLMRESVEPRDGVHPITMDPLVGPGSNDPQANPINGHEYWNRGPSGTVYNNDLQYACTFPIDARPCDSGGGSCDCSDELERNRPLCNPPGGGLPENTQHFAKAYPSSRQLDLLQQYGARSIAASICPKTTAGDVRDASFGYNPAVSAIVEALKDPLSGRCLPRQLIPRDGKVPCTVIEATFEDDCNCASKAGRLDPDGQVTSSVMQKLEDEGSCSDKPGENQLSCEKACLCEVKQLNTPACLEEEPPPAGAVGYCYIDEDQDIGNPAILDNCDSTQRRKLRFVGDGLPAKNSTTFIACAGATRASAAQD